MVGFMPLFRCIYFSLERGWALCLFLDVFFLRGVGFMPLFKCIYLVGGTAVVGFMPLFRCIYFFLEVGEWA